MTALDKNPDSKSWMIANRYRFFIHKLKNVNFYCQKVNVPGLTLGATSSPNPFIKIPQSGDHLLYDELQVSFLVDEDMANWKEVQNWLIGLGFPDSFEEYFDLAHQPIGDGLRSEAQLLILSSSNNPILEVNFMDAMPVSLTGLQFDATSPGADPMTATATFLYTKYEITTP